MNSGTSHGKVFLIWSCVLLEGDKKVHSLWAIIPLLGAVFIRSGIVPVHCWMTDLFEHATFGTSLLFVTPITGAYLAARLAIQKLLDAKKITETSVSSE